MSRSGVSIYARLALGCVTPALLAVCATPTRAAAADVPPTCTPIVARVVYARRRRNTPRGAPGLGPGDAPGYTHVPG